MTKYLVDTHALIWFLEGNPKLGNNAKNILENANSELIIPVIVLAEAVWIVDKNKTSIPSVQDLLNAIDGDPRIIIYPLVQDIISQSITIPEITEIHDRLIVATGLCLKNLGEKIALLSCDINITESKLLAIIW